jgi:hypothetical protein
MNESGFPEASKNAQRSGLGPLWSFNLSLLQRTNTRRSLAGRFVTGQRS